MANIWILSRKTIQEYENRRLLESFADQNITSILVHPDTLDLVVNKKDLANIWLNGIRADMPDAVLARTGSGSNYFCLAAMRQMENLGVPVINNGESIDRVKDKLETSQLLARHGIPIPKTMLVRWPINEDLVSSEIGWPCVVKVISGSYGKGVYLCKDRNSFAEVMELINSLSTNKSLIIQEYIGYKPGTDLRVWVVGGKVIGAMQRTSANDFRANISNGGTGSPHEITPEIEFIARETARILGLDIAGVDLLFDIDGFKVCEANSAPGFEGFETYCGQDMAKAIVDYINFRIS
jgi:glutathione synthase/RimK-type ligase-like ATP-grasp enzyme